MADNSFIVGCFFFFLIIRHPPRSPLFPSPPLFQSQHPPSADLAAVEVQLPDPCEVPERRADPAVLERGRSEEHTSELQSQSNLVCRLLLEKKKASPLRTCTVHVTHTAALPNRTDLR